MTKKQLTGKKIAIFGAGFSGLTLAWELQKLGGAIEVFEKQKYPGGLIQTTQKEVLVESAAHAFLASAEIEQLLEDLKIPIAVAGHHSKKKWIFRQQPRNWSLSWRETLLVILRISRAWIFKKKWPKPSESVAQWATRIGTAKLNDFVLAPALQGVYGSQTEDLSASLVIGGILTAETKPRKGQHKGSIAPLKGMSDLIHKLTAKLKEAGVTVHFGSTESLESIESSFEAVAIATSFRQASLLLKSSAPQLSQKLNEIPSVSLTSATIGIPKIEKKIHGFGCLFPHRENFSSLGVLFNCDLFAGRGPLESETWILDGKSLQQTDVEIKQSISQDRQRLLGQEVPFDFCQIFRWPDVLPLYGIELERLLQSDLFIESAKELKISALNVFYNGAQASEVPEGSQPVYLTGNYLGGIGLTKILSYNKRLAAKMIQQKAT